MNRNVDENKNTKIEINKCKNSNSHHNKHGIVKNVLNEYPIMDLVMILLIRSILNYHSVSFIPVSNRIPTRNIAECFWDLFTLGSY
mgnify:CR=1 FL=1